MKKQCKAMVVEGGRERHCKLPANEDGWCKHHHPDTIEDGFIQDQINDIKDSTKREAWHVGWFMQRHYPEMYNKILSESREAVEAERERREIERAKSFLKARGYEIKKPTPT